MSKAVSCIPNDEVDLSEDGFRITVNGFTVYIPNKLVAFSKEAQKRNSHFIGEYMDEAELMSIIHGAFHRGASQEDVTREVKSLCDDGWDN